MTNAAAAVYKDQSFSSSLSVSFPGLIMLDSIRNTLTRRCPASFKSSIETYLRSKAASNAESISTAELLETSKNLVRSRTDFLDEPSARLSKTDNAAFLT